MKKNYLLLGAGMMGEAIAYDLLQSPRLGSVNILDYDGSKAQNLAQKLNDPRATGLKVDASDFGYLSRFMVPFDVVISAVNYDFNLGLTKAAIKAGTHFCDLGGNNQIVEQQFQTHQEAKKKGIRIIPDCGIAPGAVSIITKLGINKLRKIGFPGYPDYVRIRVGGLPQNPQGPLKYQIVFSVHGLINECKEPAEVLKNRKRELVKSMSGLEKLVFPEPFGLMEAAYTSGGSSTLTKTYEGKIKELNYKTIRYPGHWQLMKFLQDQGFFDEELLVNQKIIPIRKITEALLEKKILGKDQIEIQYDLIDLFDDLTGHSAMQRTTGYSASIIAQMMANNQIKETGVLYQEKSIPPEIFVKEWRKRNLNLKESTHNFKPN
jgi:lysine 6-dehydrogenase